MPRIVRRKFYGYNYSSTPRYGGRRIDCYACGSIIKCELGPVHIAVVRKKASICLSVRCKYCHRETELEYVFEGDLRVSNESAREEIERELLKIGVLYGPYRESYIELDKTPPTPCDLL